jgi:hypothetical protein
MTNVAFEGFPQQIHEVTNVGMLADRIAEYGATARFLVTSRPLGEAEFAHLRASLTGGGGDARLGEYNLRHFDWAGVTQFARNWFQPAAGVHSTVSPDEFLDTITASGLRPLVRIPLLATIAAVVYEERPDAALPMDRSGLYENFVTVLLTRRQLRHDVRAMVVDRLREHGEPAERFGEFLFGHRLDCLGHLARARLASDRRRPLDLADEWIRSQGQSPPLGVDQDLVAELLLSTGLLVHQRGDLAFVHQSFAEYLAARTENAQYAAGELAGALTAGRADSLSLFRLALWVQRGNDPVPVVQALLKQLDAPHYHALFDVASMIEDGGALTHGAGSQVLRVTDVAIRRMRRLADRSLPPLNRALRAMLQRAHDGALLIRLVDDPGVAVRQRIEAARVLVTDGDAAERAAGIARLARLAYEERCGADDRLWALRTLADIGGPTERPHAVQRLVQVVETTASEANRMYALRLLAGLGELSAAVAALARRGVAPDRPLAERLRALDTLLILVPAEAGQHDETWWPAGPYAGRLNLDSGRWMAVR